MAKFLSIRFKNLLRVGNAFVKFDLQSQDITLIIGENGVGKSTIVDAISFVLFKKPLRDIKLGQLVNTINRKDLVVEIALESKGQRYVIRRGLKPNIFEIYRGKELIAPTSGLDEYQEMLERDILNLSYKTFKQVDILSKTSFVPFMQLGVADRRKIVEDLLDAHIYGVMNEIAKADLKELKLNVAETDRKIESTKMQIDSQRKLIERHNDNKADKVKLLEESKTTYHEQQDALRTDMSNIEDAIVEAKAKMAAMPIDFRKATEAVEDARSEVTACNQQAEQVNRQIERFKSLDCCPTCKQDVGTDHKAEILQSFDQMKIGLDEKRSKMEARIVKLKPFIEQGVEFANEMHRHNSDMRSKENEFNRLQTQIEMVAQKIDTLNTSTDAIGDNDSNKLEELLTSLKELIDSSDEMNAQMEVKSKCIKMTSDTGLKARLISKYIPKINERLNFYLGKMDMFVEFTLDEQFNETIKDRYRDTFTYNSFSEGQKARINNALMLTWRDIAIMRNSTVSNVLFLDEIFDGSADASANQDMAALLEMISNNGTTVYLISHNEQYRELFSKVIHVTSNGNYSEYTELA